MPANMRTTKQTGFGNTPCDGKGCDGADSTLSSRQAQRNTAFIHSICMHLHVTTCHNHNILTARVLKDGDPCADGGGGEVTSAN